MSLPGWGDNPVNTHQDNQILKREQKPVDTYHSEIYADISSKPLQYDRSATVPGQIYRDPLHYNKEDLDREICAAQAATAAFVKQQEQQQHDFNELNCRQWMHNMAEKVSTLASCTSKIQHQMIKTGDLDKDVSLS